MPTILQPSNVPVSLQPTGLKALTRRFLALCLLVVLFSLFVLALVGCSEAVVDRDYIRVRAVMNDVCLAVAKLPAELPALPSGIAVPAAPAQPVAPTPTVAAPATSASPKTVPAPTASPPAVTVTVTPKS